MRVSCQRLSSPACSRRIVTGFTDGNGQGPGTKVFPGSGTTGGYNDDKTARYADQFGLGVAGIKAVGL